MTTKQKITEKITSLVACYRRAVRDYHPALESKDPRLIRACEMRMDRSIGAIDVLHEIDPKNPAWRDTGWID